MRGGFREAERQLPDLHIDILLNVSFDDAVAELARAKEGTPVFLFPDSLAIPGTGASRRQR